MTKRFGGRQVLAGVSASVETGTVLCIRGPNGGGKTTLMRVITGLLRPTSGEVILVDEDGPWDDERRRQCCGLASPDIQLYPELTAREHMTFLSTVRDRPRAAVQQVLERVGLADRSDEPVGCFSTGMRQRLKLATALFHGPTLLCLDEPGANLDAIGRRLVTEVVMAQRERGLTVLASNDARELELGDEFVDVGA